MLQVKKKSIKSFFYIFMYFITDEQLLRFFCRFKYELTDFVGNSLIITLKRKFNLFVVFEIVFITEFILLMLQCC